MLDRKAKMEKRYNDILCPHCNAPNKVHTAITNGLQEEPIPAETDYAGYPITQVAYRSIGKYVCEHCGKEFTFDFGETRYSIFNAPLSCTNISDIRVLAKLESEYHYDYSIYRAENPSEKGRYIYYIIYEDDRNPIFITKTRAFKLMNDHKDTLNLLFCEWMTRYR